MEIDWHQSNLRRGHKIILMFIFNKDIDIKHLNIPNLYAKQCQT
jgi:hypothetical protein